MSNKLGALSDYIVEFAEAGLLRPDIPAIARAAGVSEGVVRNAISGRPVSKAALSQILGAVGAAEAEVKRTPARPKPAPKPAPRQELVINEKEFLRDSRKMEPEVEQERLEEPDPELLTASDLEPVEVARSVLHRFSGPPNPERMVHVDDGQPPATRRAFPSRSPAARPAGGIRRGFNAVDYTRG